MDKKGYVPFILQCIIIIICSCEKEFYFDSSDNNDKRHFSSISFTKSSPDSISGWWDCDTTSIPIDSSVCIGEVDPFTDTSDCGISDWLPDGYWDYSEDPPSGGLGGCPSARQQYPNGNSSQKRPSDLSSHYGSSYYNMRYEDYLRRYNLTSCPEIYYKNYGEYYYNQFMNLKNTGISDEAKSWVDRTALLLQQKLETILHDNPNVEDNLSLLRHLAFASHPSAYIEAGFFQLSMPDKIEIAMTIRFTDLFSAEGINQVAILISQQLSYYRLHGDSARADAQYMVSNWFDILNRLSDYIIQTKSASIDIDDAVEVLFGQQINYFNENIDGFSLPASQSNN